MTNLIIPQPTPKILSEPSLTSTLVSSARAKAQAENAAKPHRADSACASLFRRFTRENDTAREHNEVVICHCCPYATKTEVIEPRLDPKKYPGMNKSWYAPVDRSTYKPTEDNATCQGCFRDWLAEKKEAGKICGKCGEWIRKPGMKVESKYDDGSKTVLGFCESCTEEIFKPLLEGKKRE